jgi:CRP/FNR family transcriptional regulator, anaerobic regulatory protein
MAQPPAVSVVNNSKRERAVTSITPPEFRVLGRGEYLYREADPRTCVYRVEKGVVAVFERYVGEPASTIEIVGRGDYFGLGSLERHRDNARAVVESVISVVSTRDFALLAERDPKLGQKQDDAIAKDFESGKMLANDRGLSAPIERVAAFLIAVSRLNANEGRDPRIVSDSLKCGTVTTLLDIDMHRLGRALVRLQAIGAVEQYSEGRLYLRDLESLEHIASGDFQHMHGTDDAMPAAASN